MERASATFTVAEGASTGQFAGGPSASFGTGTTAGTLHFHRDPGQQTAQTTSHHSRGAGRHRCGGGRAQRGLRSEPGLLHHDQRATAGKRLGQYAQRIPDRVQLLRFFRRKPIAPATSPWRRHRRSSSTLPLRHLGGVFGVTAFFPVTGDADDVVAAVVQLTNSAGTAQSAQITF